MSQDPNDVIYKTEDGFIKFISDAPLEFISASSKDLKGVVDLDKRTFAFQLNTGSLVGFNSPLQQEHFYENYLETEKYPTATFTGKIIEIINVESPEWQTIRAKGNLYIHGISQERIIKCDVKLGDGKMMVRSDFMVLLADHNISIPRLVYQKIAEEIKVEIKAELVKQ